MKKRKKFLILFCILLFFLNLTKYIYIYHFKYRNDTNFQRIECRVIQKYKLKENVISYLVTYQSNQFLLNIYENQYNKKENNVTLQQYNHFVYGDILSFRGKIVIPQRKKNPYEFNYQNYLNSNKIVATITTYEVEKIGEQYGNFFIKIGNFIREQMNKKIDLHLSVDTANLMKTMLYGDDLSLSNDIIYSFRNIGISHILAVSGMHLMFLIQLLNYFLKNQKRFLIVFSNILFMSLFCIISAFSISVIRACIMTFFSLIDDKKEYSPLRKLLFCFLCIISYHPFYLLNISFQFSFLATLGIITYSSLIQSFFFIKLKIPLIFRYFINLLSISLSANFLLLPIQIFYFHRFEPITFISNILLTPIFTFSFFIGFLSLFFLFVPYVSDFLITSNFILLKFLLFLIQNICKINYFTIYIAQPSHFELFIIYFCIWSHTTKKYIPALFNRKIKYWIRKALTFITLLSFLYILSMYIYRKYFENYIYFFNVEQGNMAIIRDNRKTIVVDMGSTNQNIASNVLSSFLNAKAIHHIDAVFLTHMHEDHLNGLYELCENFSIKTIVYTYPSTFFKGEFSTFNKLLQEKNIPRTEIIQEDTITIGNIHIEVLMPSKEKNIVAKDMLNANSTIYLITKKQKHYLFMGDATKETEKELLENLPASTMEKLTHLSAIQIGHHGSNTSSSEFFIQKINPCIAIISSKKEKYGHPHKDTLERLTRYNFTIKVTEMDGAIKL